MFEKQASLSKQYPYEVNPFRQKSTKLGLKVYLFSMGKACKRGVSFRCVHYSNKLSSLLSTILTEPWWSVVSGQLKIGQYAWRGKMVKINFIIYIIKYYIYYNYLFSIILQVQGIGVKTN